MPRKPYDASCVLIGGPSSGSPGVVIGFGPCRLVYDSYLLPLTFPYSQRTAYVTLDFTVPAGPSVFGSDNSLAWEFGSADVISIPPVTNPPFQVLWVETVTPTDGPVYYRCHVRPLLSGPYYSVGGGILLGGSSSYWISPLIYDVGGGILLGGSSSYTVGAGAYDDAYSSAWDV